MGRFLPLVPPVPALSALAAQKSGQLQTRERLRGEYLTQVKTLFNEFLAAYIEQVDRDAIWRETETEIDRAFNQFSLSDLTLSNSHERQQRVRNQIDEALRRLLMLSLEMLDGEQLIEALDQYIDQQQDKWRRFLGSPEYGNYVRNLILSAIDREWRDYLGALEVVRHELGLGGLEWGHPLAEYQRRAGEMYADMRRNIEDDIAERFFRDIANHSQSTRQQEAKKEQESRAASGYEVVRRPTGKGVETRQTYPIVGRNYPCPCGSGIKYKYCHGRPAGARPRRISAAPRTFNAPRPVALVPSEAVQAASTATHDAAARGSAPAEPKSLPPTLQPSRVSVPAIMIRGERYLAKKNWVDATSCFRSVLFYARINDDVELEKSALEQLSQIYKITRNGTLALNVRDELRKVKRLEGKSPWYARFVGGKGNPPTDDQ